MQELDSTDKQIAAHDQKNAVFRKRLLLLIPFNFLSLYGTIRYFQNIQKIAKKFWPNRQKATVFNLFLIGTAQAVIFTTFYVGGSLAILGMNPAKFVREGRTFNEL